MEPESTDQSGQVEREIPSFSLRAEIRPQTVNPDKRTVDVTWSTGARVLRGWWDRWWEELSLDPKHVRMGRLNNGAPLLDAHNLFQARSVLGVVESARLEKQEGVATVRFSKAEDDPEADKIFRKVRDGIIQNVSIGYQVYRFEKVEDGDDKIPVMRATDWEPFEISFVPVGADDGAGTRAQTTRQTNRCTFVTAQERTMGFETDSTERKTTTPAATSNPDQTPETAARSSEDTQEQESAKAAQAGAESERKRAASIRALVARQSALSEEARQELADQLVDEGVSAERAGILILDRLAAESDKSRTDQHVRVGSGDDERDKKIRGAEAWLIKRAGKLDLLRKAAEKIAKVDPKRAEMFRVETDPGEFRGMTLRDLARDFVERAGVNTRGMDAMEMVGRAFSYRGNYQTTSDFSTLLETALHKILLAGYELAEDTWPRFCGRTSMTDFRAHNFYRLGMFGALDAINENGEFTRKAIPDAEKESITLGTYGNIIGLSRKAIVNDDMGAFSRLASTFGLAAALTIEEAVYTLLALHSGLGPTLTDGEYLFSAGRNTTNIGTGATLTMESIDLDRTVMGAHKDLNNKRFLAIRPSVLLVPLGLGGTARSINEARYDPDTSGKLQKPNTVLGLFRDIVDTPYLAAGTTRRYMFADPSMNPAIVVGFLEGEEAPVMETQEGFNIDGSEWKIRLDFAVGAVEWRTALTNAGTA